MNFSTGADYSVVITAVDVEGESPSQPHTFQIVNTGIIYVYLKKSHFFVFHSLIVKTIKFCCLRLLQLSFFLFESYRKQNFFLKEDCN